jgi:hypothetical protein
MLAAEYKFLDRTFFCEDRARQNTWVALPVQVCIDKASAQIATLIFLLR